MSRPSQVTYRGREALPEHWQGLGGAPGGSAKVGRPSQWVKRWRKSLTKGERLFRRAGRGWEAFLEGSSWDGMGRESLLKGRYGSGGPPRG